MTMSAHELTFVQQHTRPSVRALRPRLSADRDLYYSQTVPPTNVDVPHATGTGTVGLTLTCTMGNWTGTPVAYGYQWLHDAALILGATRASYVIAPGDSGHSLSCQVTAFTGGGQASSVSNAVVVA
jgi:hypothetical protein